MRQIIDEYLSSLGDKQDYSMAPLEHPVNHSFFPFLVVLIYEIFSFTELRRQESYY
jgi:hypothetical protein